MLRIIGAALAASLAFATQAMAADAPSEIKIGTLYASSGRYASISMPVYSSLKLWVEQKNAEGGRVREGVRQEDPDQARLL
ncbi:hypothetical protein ACQPTN_17170 [Bradyrhizobium sp. 13971]